MRRIARHNIPATRLVAVCSYDGVMNKQDHLQEHLKLCQSIYERLKREGRWPWPDSTDNEKMVESEDIDTRA